MLFVRGDGVILVNTFCDMAIDARCLLPMTADWRKIEFGFVSLPCLHRSRLLLAHRCTPNRTKRRNKTIQKCNRKREEQRDKRAATGKRHGDIEDRFRVGSLRGWLAQKNDLCEVEAGKEFCSIHSNPLASRPRCQLLEIGKEPIRNNANVKIYRGWSAWVSWTCSIQSITCHARTLSLLITSSKRKPCSLT